MNYRRDGEKILDALSFLVQIKLFVKPGLESMNFSWTKNNDISRLFRTISTDLFHKI